MKALLLSKYRHLEIAELPIPTPGPGELLVQVAACGICGSDVHGYDGASGRRIPPIVMGHEAAGRVAGVGPQVTGWSEGDRITFDSTIFCGTCRYCSRGEVNLCDHRQVLGVSCSDYLCAGAFAMVFPFIILKTYHGDAHLLAVMMVVFFSGATVSNFALLRFMPMLRMGRLFLIMQLSRIVILLALWSQPNAIVLALFTFIWGVNMGVTSTTCRAIVQERAEPAYRGRVLSVLNIGFLGAQPFAALILGWVIALVGPMNALLPGVAVSVLIFAFGTLRTRVWRYESASALAARPVA